MLTPRIRLLSNAEALGSGEYAKLVEALMGNRYQQRRELRDSSYCGKCRQAMLAVRSISLWIS
jgi:hypothetical protein